MVMRCKWKWVVLWSLWAARLVRQPTTPVRVTSGWLRGSIAPSGTYAQYFGIPYATVTQRFQAAGPEPTWTGTFNAINENTRCAQSISIGSSIVLGEENCLILNVYTPLSKESHKSYPVMIYIHGGGFFEGSSFPILYGPEYLIEKDVILVTINYRLNIQGFLCLGIKEAPGNAGLKDQVAALKWVQRNIAAFNGDPDNVTIFGESAGSASVSFHLLSPMSKGLFHKAILQSGSSLASWSFQYDPIYVASLKAKLWDFKSDNPRNLFNFFINKSDAELIIKVVPKTNGNIAISQLIFLPCVEKNIEGVEPFLSDLPHKLLSEGKYNKVPMIVGSNTGEGLLFIDLEKDEYIPKIKVEVALPKNLDFPSDIERNEIVNEVTKHYLGDKNVSLETKVELSKFVGESFFNYPSVEETNLIVQNNENPVYYYLLGYDGSRNLVKWSTTLNKESGVAHADDIFYLFSQPILPTLLENRIIDQMTTMWTNFAKHGDPTPAVTDLLPVRWPRVSKESENQQALYIDKQMKTVPLFYNEGMVFWKKVYSKYRRKK